MALNGKWTRENFDKFHSQNPKIYEAFKKFAFLASQRREHYSAKMVMYRVRWDTEIVENNPSAEFKIDDGWISHYARMLMDDYPHMSGFFETRVRADSYHRIIPKSDIDIQESLL